MLECCLVSPYFRFQTLLQLDTQERKGPSSRAKIRANKESIELPPSVLHGPEEQQRRLLPAPRLRHLQHHGDGNGIVGVWWRGLHRLVGGYGQFSLCRFSRPLRRITCCTTICWQSTNPGQSIPIICGDNQGQHSKCVIQCYCLGTQYHFKLHQ